MTVDIVDRLREPTGDVVSDQQVFSAALKAADEIERLRDALKPFAFLEDDTAQEAWELRFRDRFKDWIDFGDIENARKVLKEAPAEHDNTDKEQSDG